MRYREDEPALCFGSADEADAFHLELTTLIREAMVAAAAGVPDTEADAAVARSRDVFKRYKTVTRALNSMRRTGGAIRPDRTQGG